MNEYITHNFDEVPLVYHSDPSITFNSSITSDWNLMIRESYHTTSCPKLYFDTNTLV